jgi:iron-sulfur cluster assembly accessory protein
MFRYLIRSISIKITPECAKQIQTVCKENEFLRVSVDAGSGCGGFSYKFEVTSESSEDDHVILEGEAKVLIDSESAKLISGAEIDFTQSMIRRSFLVKNNPLAEMTCGCGTSFSPKALKFN